MLCFVAIEDRFFACMQFYVCDMTTPPPSMPIHIFYCKHNGQAKRATLAVQALSVCVYSSLQIKQPQGTTQVSEGARGPGLYMS